MLSVNYRFHGHGSLRYVYKNGHALRSRFVTLKYSANPRRKTSRFAVVVSKKVHKSAVSRNRVRRRIYEVIRHELPLLKTNCDIVVIVVSSDLLTLPPSELQEALRQLFLQARLYQ